ncbi:unnamed protein product [Cylicostephanus goldi]|uniref:Uncharacterized protein n=1 Tax=Cylicostephanus goldi TaxID=71465 RepID=A0A3P7MML5_CYLGO|nr:unnamed protein product [Cylicostephanus goldi]
MVHSKEQLIFYFYSQLLQLWYAWSINIATIAFLATMSSTNYLT